MEKRAKLHVQVIKHKNVKGKELLYLDVGGVLINVGNATFNAVEEKVDRELTKANLVENEPPMLLEENLREKAKKR